jgi:hypothetical protein
MKRICLLLIVDLIVHIVYDVLDILLEIFAEIFFSKKSRENFLIWLFLLLFWLFLLLLAERSVGSVCNFRISRFSTVQPRVLPADDKLVEVFDNFDNFDIEQFVNFVLKGTSITTIPIRPRPNKSW